MRLTNPIRKGESNSSGCGCYTAVLILGILAIIFFRHVPEGKQIFKLAMASMQPPVQVSLSPFLIFDGYYVHVTNTSKDKVLTGVQVIYTSASGNSTKQNLGTLKPGEQKVLDPSDVSWQVVKHETIAILADGDYAPKVLETNVLIQK